jgi:hypothetical protein
VINQNEPGRIIVARMGCPVVLGLGNEENFVASDVAALLPVTRRLMFLDEGDVAESHGAVSIIDRDGTGDRLARDSELSADAAEKGQHKHFMLKEIHEQRRQYVAGTRCQWPAAQRRLVRRPADLQARGKRADRGLRTSFTPASWRVTSSSRSAAFRAASRLPASTVTAIRWWAGIAVGDDFAPGETADTLAAMRS